ncbi:MAG: AAA family ATPase, partial [Anaerolineae bacterium]|nr:AAA family ATPase [Anaerolineae bacterium]
VATVQELEAAQEAVKAVYVAPVLKRYIVDLVPEREHPQGLPGGQPARGASPSTEPGRPGPRSTDGTFVLPDDVKALVLPALGHRLILGPADQCGTSLRRRFFWDLLERVPVPGADLRP